MVCILALLAVIVLVALSRSETPGPPCEPGDCDTCPFPSCTEEDKKRHMGL